MSEFVWVFPAITVLLAIATFYAGWVTRVGKGESAAEAAKVAAADVSELRTELAEFKERVARDYATANMVTAVETRVITAIDRLADRLDRLLEMRPPTVRRPTAK